MHQTLIKLISSAVALFAVGGASVALAASHHHPKAPVQVTVLSPGPGDHSGQAGVGFIVDVSLDATRRNANSLLSQAAGYKRSFTIRRPLTLTRAPIREPRGSSPCCPALP